MDNKQTSPSVAQPTALPTRIFPFSSFIPRTFFFFLFKICNKNLAETRYNWSGGPCGFQGLFSITRSILQHILHEWLGRRSPAGQQARCWGRAADWCSWQGKPRLPACGDPPRGAPGLPGALSPCSISLSSPLPALCFFWALPPPICCEH